MTFPEASKSGPPACSPYGVHLTDRWLRLRAIYADPPDEAQGTRGEEGQDHGSGARGAAAMARNTRIIRAVVTEGVDGYTVMVWLRSDEAEVLLADRPVVNLTQAKGVADEYAKALRIPRSRVRLSRRRVRLGAT